MGQYKVPQDVEAEDKIIGSLTLRQFIFAALGVIYGLVSFFLLRGVPILFITVGLLPTFLLLMLGLFKRQDQPFEALFLALLSFLSNSRQRIWVKEPITEVFRVEAPPPTVAVVADDPSAVRGQLTKLAQIVDTRGWSLKQPELQEPSAPHSIDLDNRIAGGDANANVQPLDVHASDDILDLQNNPAAQNIGQLIQNQATNIRQEAVKTVAEQQATSTAPAAINQPPATDPQPQTHPAIIKRALDNEGVSVARVAAAAKKQSTALTEGQATSVRGEE